MSQLEHPQLTEMNKKGYLNALNQPENMGFDYFNNELVSGDEVVEYDGDIVLRDNLDDYLAAKGFAFKTL